MGKLIRKLQNARGSGSRAIEDNIAARETGAEVLDDLLRQLTDRELTILVLLAVPGLTANEAATAYGRSKTAVYECTSSITRKRQGDCAGDLATQWSEMQPYTQSDLAADALYDPPDAELMEDARSARTAILCGGCQRLKPRADFAPKRGYPTQLSVQCIDCHAAAKAYKQRKKETA